METIVLHSILETELGRFFLCLVCKAGEESLSFHPIKSSHGVDVIYPAEEIDKKVETNLIAKLKALLLP